MSLPTAAEGVFHAAPKLDNPHPVVIPSPAEGRPGAAHEDSEKGLRLFVPVEGPSSDRGELRRNLSAIIREGALWSVMVGCGESCFGAYALALGLGDVLSAQVSTLPVLAGATLQLAVPGLVRRTGSNRTWVMATCVLQALSMLLLSTAIWAGPAAGAMIFASVTLYWACGFGGNPAWSTWMEELVPRRMRARFFAFRTRISQFILLTTMLAVGGILQYGKSTGHALGYFSGLFVAAAVARMISVRFMSQQSDSPVHRQEAASYTWREAILQLSSGGSGRLIAYLLSIQAVVYISGPYFTPYILEELKFGYWHQMALSATALVGRVVAMPWLGRFAHTAGPRRLLWLGGLMIVPLSSAWIVSNDFYYLMGLQFVCGVAWAAYELAMFLMFFETMPKAQRTTLLSYYHFGSALAQFSGGLAGAWILLNFGHDASVYHALFILSSILRVGALVLLARIPAVASGGRAELETAEAAGGIPAVSASET